MRKAVSAILLLVLALITLSGCSSGTPTISRMGLGHLSSIAKSTDLTADKDGKPVPPVGQVDTVIAAVGFDKAGKVVKVVIDSAQTKVSFDKDLKVASDVAAKGKTKVELADGYGMGKVSTIKKEWYQQAAELEKWMTGKTVEQIKAMKTKQRDASHPSVPDVPELTSLVTITVQDYIAAVEEAYRNAVDVTKGAVKLGLGHEVSIGSSKSYSVVDGKETLPLAQVDTVIAAAAFDKDGKAVKTIIDTAQTKVQYSKDGKVTTDKSAPLKTKKELADAYGMVKASAIKKEWYQQIAELEKWMAGKTIDQIKAMKTKQRDASHPAVPDVAELTSLVTVSVQDYIAAVAEASQKAR